MQAYRAILKKASIEFIDPVPEFEEAEVCVVVINSVQKADPRVVVGPQVSMATTQAAGQHDAIAQVAALEWMNSDEDNTDWEEVFNV